MTKHSQFFLTEPAPDFDIAECLAEEDCLRFSFVGAERRDGVVARAVSGLPVAAATMADLQDSLAGVTPGTPVLTADGWRSAGEIVVGDLLQTRNGRMSKVVSIAKRDFGWRALGVNPLLQPVRIPRGTFDVCWPLADILVAPGQGLAIGPDEDAQVIVARGIVGQGGASRCTQTAVTYVAFHLQDGPFVLRPAG